MLPERFRDEHQPLVDTLTRAAQATMVSMRAGVTAVDAACMMLDDPRPKHGIEPTDHLRSHTNVDVEKRSPSQLRCVLVTRKKVVLAPGCTDFASSAHVR
jgi:hypothetical protein